MKILLVETTSWWQRFNQSFGDGGKDGGHRDVWFLPEQSSLSPGGPLESPGGIWEFWCLCSTPEFLIELLRRREPESRSFQIPQVRVGSAGLEVQTTSESARKSWASPLQESKSQSQIQWTSNWIWVQDCKSKSSKWGRNGAQCKIKAHGKGLVVSTAQPWSLRCLEPQSAWFNFWGRTHRGLWLPV